MAITSRRRTRGPHKPSSYGPHTPVPHKPGPAPDYDAYIDKMLVSFGYKPGKQGLMFFIGCADSISGVYKMWGPFKPGSSRKEIYAWMKKIYAICMANKPAATLCSAYFQGVCKKAEGYKPAPSGREPIPMPSMPKPSGNRPTPQPRLPRPPGPIPSYVRGTKRRRRNMRG